MLRWQSGQGGGVSAAWGDEAKGSKAETPGAGKTETDAGEARRDGETPTGEGTSNIVIEWAGTYESIVYMIEIHNAGSKAVDLGNFQLAAGSCSDAGGLRVVKGSSRISPGERALILTHSSVPTDDQPRQQYANLLVATGHADSLTTQDASALALVDAGGAFADVPLGPVMADPAVGECCMPVRDTQQCWMVNSPPCEGSGSGCWVLVTKSYCCAIPACGWKESAYGGGCTYGCPGTGWTCCQ